jgi:spore germination protein YaaH
MRILTILIFLSIVVNINAQTAFKSIHQTEIETYNASGNTSAEYYESLPSAQPINREKGGCNLNKVVYGWHPYWSGSAYTNYQWDLLSHFSFFSYEVNAADGEAVSTHGWSTSAAVNAALASNTTKVTLCVTLFSNHSTFFGSATAQQTLIDNLINLIQTRGAHGVNIDFEGLPSTQTTNFANFMVNLSNQMHVAIPGSEVSTVLYAVDWNNVFNFTIMAPVVDHFIIMGYDYYYSGSSTAGPTDPLYHFGTNYNYTLSRSITYYLDKGCPANKLILGLPYYGHDYPTSGVTIPSNTTGTGSSRTYTVVKGNTSGNYTSGNQTWLSDALEDAFAYTSGGTRQCFLALDSAFSKRLDHVNKTGIAGIGMWALGYDDGYVERWNSIEDYMTDCYQDACSGDIHDFGGPLKDYNNNEDYTWTIQPPNATSIDINFTLFNVELDYDYLYVYDGPNTSSPQIAGSPFTGTSSPGQFTTTSGAVTFRFTSDISTVGPGFLATYACSTQSPPVASFTLNGNLEVCLGDSLLLTSTSVGAESYSWSSNAGVLSTNSNQQTYLHPEGSGNYIVTLDVTNGAGSSSQSQLLSIQVVSPVQAIALVNSTTFQLPNATVFFTNLSTNADAYYWDFGDGTTSNDFQPWHSYSQVGTYNAIFIASNLVCGNDTIYFTINVGENGIEEENLLFQVWPNPTSENLHLQFDQIQSIIYEIKDLNGKVILSGRREGNSAYLLNTSLLSSGMYLLEIQIENQKSIVRFIKH